MGAVATRDIRPGEVLIREPWAWAIADWTALQRQLHAG